MSTRPLILLVRHGRTELNEGSPKIRAWENPPLDRNGELDAQMAASKLKPYNPQMIYHSDLLRDTQTAHIIAGILDNIPAEPDFRLRTADLGEWTGQDESVVHDLLLRWYQEPWMRAPSGESVNDFNARWFDVYEEKLDIAREIDSFCPTVLAVHGRNFASLHSRYHHVPLWESRMPLPGGLGMVSEGSDGRDTFEFLGDTEPILTDR